MNEARWYGRTFDAGPGEHLWTEIPFVEGYFCAVWHCSRCGTARVGPLGGYRERGVPIYDLEYRVGRPSQSESGPTTRPGAEV